MAEDVVGEVVDLFVGVFVGRGGRLGVHPGGVGVGLLGEGVAGTFGVGRLLGDGLQQGGRHGKGLRGVQIGDQGQVGLDAPLSVQVY